MTLADASADHRLKNGAGGSLEAQPNLSRSIIACRGIDFDRYQRSETVLNREALLLPQRHTTQLQRVVTPRRRRDTLRTTALVTCHRQVRAVHCNNVRGQHAKTHTRHASEEIERANPDRAIRTAIR